jgi:serine protease Do
MSNNISQDRPFVRSVAITAALGEQRFRHCRLSMMVFLLALVFIAIGQKARAFQIPDFEKLVNEHGKAVVKVTVIGRTSPSGFDNQLPDLPPQFRYFFENLPQQQPQPQPQPRSGFGSGFIISDDGYIVTNAHVVDNAEEVRIQLPDRSEYQAEIIGSDERSDIAVLKIDAEGLPTVTIGNSDDVNVGQWVLAIGSPFGFEYTATQGIVSAVSRSLPNENYVPFIQTDAAVNPGNSGGPLFDTEGRVVGVNAQIYSRSGGYMGLSFAIPINVAMSVVDQIKSTGYVSRGWLGVYIQNVDQPLAESFGLERPMGAVVSRVTKDSPAEKAGVQPGDVILSFNGTPINKSSELPPLVGLVPVGNEVQMELQRRNETIQMNVTIAELDDGESQNGASPGLRSNSGLGVVIGELSASQKALTGGIGILIQQVEPNSVAASAGILSGDFLLSFNQTDLTSARQLQQLIKDAPRGKPLAVLIQRNNQPLFSTLTLE